MADTANPTRLAGNTALVTGASGFLGSHTVGALIEEGAIVHCLTRQSALPQRLARYEGNITLHQGDVRDFESMLQCFSRVEPMFVFHFAGDSMARRSSGGWNAIQQSIAVNLNGTLNTIRAATTVGSMVGMIRAGGLEEYGIAPLPFAESSRERPVSAYSASQVATTHFCQTLQPGLGFPLVTLRPALVYGPGQAQQFFIPQLIESCLSGACFEMTSGIQKRDLIYVDDVVAGFLLAASRTDLAGEVLNLATGFEHSMNSVADMIVRLCGRHVDIRRGARPTTHSDLEHLVGSTEHAASVLRWRSKVSLEQGLHRTVEWYRSSRAAGSTA